MKEMSFVRRVRGSASIWFLFLLVLLVLGGGVYVYLEQQKKRREVAIVRAEEMKERQKAEQARLAELAEKREAAAEAKKKRQEEMEARRREAEKRNLAQTPSPSAQRTDQKSEDTVEEVKKIKRAASNDPRLEIFEKELVLTGIKALNTENRKLWSEMLKAACETNAWDYLKVPLEYAIQKEFNNSSKTGEFNFSEYYGNSLFRQAVALYELIDKLEDETYAWINEQPDAPLDQSFMYYFVNNRDNSLLNFTASLTDKETPEELGRILIMWKKLWESSPPEFRKKYQSLAIACSLVNPEKRERCKVKGAESMTMEEVYRQFCESTENKSLKMDVSKLPANDLVHVVDLGIPLQEMKWAQEHVDLPYSNWKSVYEMVPLAKESMSLQGGDYLFSELKEKGGNERDRAYFAANTAKSNGIPAALVTGRTDDEAWFIYMDTSSSWNGQGRPAGYLEGKINDPRSGGKVYEASLVLRSSKSTAESVVKLHEMLKMNRFLALLGHYGPARRLLTNAQLEFPDSIAVWKTTVEAMKLSGERVYYEEWEELAETLRRRYKIRPDFIALVDQIEKDILIPNKETRRITGSSGGRLTESRIIPATVQIWKEVNEQLKLNRQDNARKLLEDAMKSYSKRNDALKTINRMLYEWAQEQPRHMNKILGEMEAGYRKNVETKSKFYFTIRREIEILNQIALYYRTSGNLKKAEALEKEANLRYRSGSMAAF